MDEELIRQFKSLDLFKDISDPVLAKIASQTRTLEPEKGDILIKEGDSSDSFFVIRRGWVKVVTYKANGEEVVLNQCGPGEVVGEMSIIDQAPRSNTIIVLSSAKMLEIKYGVILEAFEENPKLALAFLRDVTNRLRFANAYIEEAIEWCQQIAAGNYDFVEQQVDRTRSTIIDLTKSHATRANAFLSSFFKMVKDVKHREESLKRQVLELTIQIDQAKREKTVQELTSTPFFSDLQAAARKLRSKRSAEIEKPLETDEEE